MLSNACPRMSNRAREGFTRWYGGAKTRANTLVDVALYQSAWSAQRGVAVHSQLVWAHSTEVAQPVFFDRAVRREAARQRPAKKLQDACVRASTAQPLAHGTTSIVYYSAACHKNEPRASIDEPAVTALDAHAPSPTTHPSANTDEPTSSANHARALNAEWNKPAGTYSTHARDTHGGGKTSWSS
jgi:hypothetical protein